MLKTQRLVLLLFADAAIIAAVVVASYALRFDGVIPPQYATQIPWVAMGFIAVQTGFLVALGLYNRVWAYASLPELFNIVIATRSKKWPRLITRPQQRAASDSGHSMSSTDPLWCPEACLLLSGS